MKTVGSLPLTPPGRPPALVVLLLAAGCVGFDYQVTIEPTIDPNSVGSGVGTVAAGFRVPAGVSVDGENDLYVADSGNHVVRLVNGNSGSSRVVAGAVGERGLLDDARGEDARLFMPSGTAVHPDGSAVYIADTNNNAIRRMSTSGDRAVDTLWAGYSSTPAELALYGAVNVTGLWGPTGLAVWSTAGSEEGEEADFAVLIADTENHRIVALRPPAGGGTPWRLSLFAGTGSKDLLNGAAATAAFRYPHGIAACLSGAQPEVLVADTGNNIIRRIRYHTADPAAQDEESGWMVSTMAGDGSPGAEDSQTKREKPKASVLITTILSARFSLPEGVACDGEGGAVVADTLNQAVRLVTADGITVTLAGGRGRGGADGSGGGARFAEPAAIAFVPSKRRAYVVERGNQKVRRVSVGDIDLVMQVDSDAPRGGRGGGAGSYALAGALVTGAWWVLRGQRRVAMQC